MRFFQVLIPLILVSSCFFNKVNQDMTLKSYAVYDQDNRQFIIDGESKETSEIKQNSKSVAAMVRKKLLREDDNPTNFTFKELSVSRRYNVCSDQSFAQNNSLSICTGFLIADDLLVTAAHCLVTKDDCRNYSWVFDYKANSKSIKKENVYNCREVIFRKEKLDREDYIDIAVIKLETKTNRKPLKLRTYGRLAEETPVYMIGHPLGMGLTLANNAKTYPMDRKRLMPTSYEPHQLDFFNAQLIHQDKLFITDLDSFGGNSGSPVFNANTNIVEGIMLGGADDFNPRQDEYVECGENNQINSMTGKIEEHVLRVRDIPQLQEVLLK